ncbi:NAD(P)-dependent oxidoreductase [Chloroflexota bacterium]
MNIYGRMCVVVSDNQITLGKVKVLLRCGATVEVISHAFCS